MFPLRFSQVVDIGIPQSSIAASIYHSLFFFKFTGRNTRNYKYLFILQRYELAIRVQGYVSRIIHTFRVFS